MQAIVDFLDGKKTIIAGLLVSLISGLSLLGVKFPFDPSKVTVDSILLFLGGIVVLCRIFAKKQLAGPSATLTK